MKSRFKLSPFVDCLDNDRRKSLKAKFTKWRRQINAKKRDVGINPKYFVGPEYFVEIEKARTHLSTTLVLRALVCRGFLTTVGPTLDHCVVLVCNVEQHWVVCLLRIDAWEITLFDSLPSPDCVRQLEHLSRLIPYVIAKGGYFDAKSVAPRFDLMPVVSIPMDDELVQGDVHNCGVFACMYIERMIACDFPQSSSKSEVKEYRRKIALEIFAHSDEVTS
ncbi:Sentrin-specific protease 5 [Castilleja foliolosa]|uniref:Sentrin-specific protease 5 n=1 Tax=Castilleja foliolosa TaxID=1961234 RepID=A0ABD3DAA0_9LAMI